MRMVLGCLCLGWALAGFAAGKGVTVYAGAGEWRDARGDRDSGYARFLYGIGSQEDGSLRFKFRWDLLVGGDGWSPQGVIVKDSERQGHFHVLDTHGNKIGTGRGNCLLDTEEDTYLRHTSCELRFEQNGTQLVFKTTYDGPLHIAFTLSLDGDIDMQGKFFMSMERSMICSTSDDADLLCP